MQGRVDARGYFSGVIGSIQERIYITAFVCPSKEVVELPHGQPVVRTPEIHVLKVGFCHAVNLRVGNKQPWDAFLVTLWQALVKSHLSNGLCKLVLT